MNNYKPFLIQKLKEGAPVRDSKEWGIWIKHVPFILYPKIKSLTSRSWPDENGDDEFVPDRPTFEAYTMDVQFVFIGSEGTANQKIRSFLDYLANDGEFSLYDTFSKIGRTHVRYSEYSEKAFWRKDGTNDIIEFTVKLKVNDPLTEITLSK